MTSEKGYNMRFFNVKCKINTFYPGTVVIEVKLKFEREHSQEKEFILRYNSMSSANKMT